MVVRSGCVGGDAAAQGRAPVGGRRGRWTVREADAHEAPRPRELHARIEPSLGAPDEILHLAGASLREPAVEALGDGQGGDGHTAHQRKAGRARRVGDDLLACLPHGRIQADPSGGRDGLKFSLRSADGTPG